MAASIGSFRTILLVDLAWLRWPNGTASRFFAASRHTLVQMPLLLPSLVL
jgi:hypothetical protein